MAGKVDFGKGKFSVQNRGTDQVVLKNLESPDRYCPFTGEELEKALNYLFNGLNNAELIPLSKNTAIVQSTTDNEQKYVGFFKLNKKGKPNYGIGLNLKEEQALWEFPEAVKQLRLESYHAAVANRAREH